MVRIQEKRGLNECYEEEDPYWNQTEKDRKCVNISATHPQPQLAERKITLLVLTPRRNFLN